MNSTSASFKFIYAFMFALDPLTFDQHSLLDFVAPEEMRQRMILPV
jgi:hypothetical protein